jgi:ATP-binding cassette subfamily B protein
MLLKGSIDLSQFVLFVGAITQLSTFIDNLFSTFEDAFRASNDVTVIMDFLSISTNNNREPPEEWIGKKLEVEFKNVSFSYGDNVIIDELSFCIRGGEKIAVVGENGAGKSTIIKLMCGLLKPTFGNIYVNGVSLQTIDGTAYQTLISSVFQDILILPFTIAQNVAAVSDELIDKDRVMECLHKAGLELSDIDLKLDKAANADGIELSGGQKQKLMIARTIYKDAPLVILDEPTSGLDPIAESRLYEEYSKFTANKTAVFVSHRLASTSFCDRILFIENGKIAESGTHVELLRFGGKYSDMFNSQRKYYSED